MTFKNLTFNEKVDKIKIGVLESSKQKEQVEQIKKVLESSGIESCSVQDIIKNENGSWILIDCHSSDTDSLYKYFKAVPSKKDGWFLIS